ncbi:M23 family metallopeptidase [Patescibacteria group bacterium]
MKKVLLLFLCSCFFVDAAASETLIYPSDPYDPGSYGGRGFFIDKDHLGEDIGLSEGTPVRAMKDGTIVAYQPSDGYGELVSVVEHDLGSEYAFINAYGNIVNTRYILSISGHIRKKEKRDDLNSLSWSVEDSISQGNVLGYINNDGIDPDPNGDGAEHLHQGIRLSDKATAASRDPGGWFRGYEKNTTQGQDFASPAHVIEVVNNGGIEYLCKDINASLGRGICWVPSSKSNASCLDASSWTYYYSWSEVWNVYDNSYCPSDSTVAVYIPEGDIGSIGGGGVGTGPGIESDPDPEENSDPGEPNFVVTDVKLKTVSGEEKYIWDKSEELYTHAWFDNKGDADWEGSHDYVEVRYYLSKGLKEDLHSEWQRVGIDYIQKYNLDVSDDPKHEEDRLILLNKESIVPGNYYNIVVCVDRTVDQNNGGGDVDEIHESDNCSTEAVFYVSESSTSNKLTNGQIMAIMNMLHNN